MLKDKKLFLFDIDGTIAIGDTLYDGSRELISYIESIGGKAYYITNNSTKSNEDYVKKFEKSFGLKTTEKQFITSGFMTKTFLLDNYSDKTIFVLGTDSYVEDLRKSGLKVTTEVEEEIALVVVAYDSELNYDKLTKVSQVLFEKDVPFYATNPDLRCPIDFGFIPDCGAICDMITATTDKKPIYLGKPNKKVVEICLADSGFSKEERENIKPDGSEAYNTNAGTIGEQEPTDSKRVTVLTKFWKEWNKEGTGYRIMCEQVTEKAHVRKPWDIGTKYYPFAKMSWLPRFSCIYGDSEITHMIPNQIAINRALSAEVWGIMKTGMPTTVINGDIVTDTFTNTPGQVLKVFGGTEDVAGAIRHIQPPAFAGQLITAVDNLASNTLSDNGANDAALGNLRPDNAAAIIQLREAALQPMQLIQNRFYDFVEDVARIWADFWLSNYGDRKLKYENKDGTYYVPFHASRYDKLLLTARIDVGSSPLWDISSTVAMLDGMLSNQIINKQQYLDRIPAGIIPDIQGLIEDAKEEMQAQQGGGDVMQLLAQQYPELYAKFGSLPPEQQQQILAKISGGQMSTPQEV